MDFQTMSKQRKFMLIAAGIGVISMFLPWVSISIMGFSSSVNGFHDIGILIFLCFAGCGVLAFMGDQKTTLDKTMWMIALIASVVAAAIMVINFIRALDIISYLGFGFYIALAASLFLVYATFMYRGTGMNVKDSFDSLKNDIESKTKSDNTNPPA